MALTAWRKTVGMALLTAIFTLCVAPSLADQTHRCRVLTVEATKGSKRVDARLRHLASLFAHPPFDRFSSFTLVDERTYTLRPRVKTPLRLPSRLVGALQVDSGSSGPLRLTMTLGRPGGKPVVVHGDASAGTPLVAGGFKSPAGNWIFIVICNP